MVAGGPATAPLTLASSCPTRALLTCASGASRAPVPGQDTKDAFFPLVAWFPEPGVASSILGVAGDVKSLVAWDSLAPVATVHLGRGPVER